MEELIAKAVMNHMRGKATEKDLYPFLHHDFEHTREEWEDELIEREQRRMEVQAKNEAAMARIREEVEARKKAEREGKK